MRIRRSGVVAVISLAASLLATAALYADFQSGYYASAAASSLVQEGAPRFSVDANYEVGMYPIYSPGLPSGEGATEVKSYCTTCHSPRYITMQPPLAAVGWASEVDKMIKTYGASIPDDSKQKIVHYLQTRFTPETRRRF